MLTPDAAVLLFTFGTCLIFVELNRPGLVLPGSGGLLAVLLAIASLTHVPWNAVGWLLLLAAAAVSCWPLRRTVAAGWVLVAISAWTFGLRLLLAGPVSPPVHWPVAVPCGITLGATSSLLARIAHRARRNKGLN